MTLVNVGTPFMKSCPKYEASGFLSLGKESTIFLCTLKTKIKKKITAENVDRMEFCIWKNILFGSSLSINFQKEIEKLQEKICRKSRDNFVLSIA